MYKASKVTVTSKTVPVLIFTVHGNVTDPIPISIRNSGTHTLLIGGSTTATCTYPVPKNTVVNFSVIGGDSLYGKLTTTGTIPVHILKGRQ